MFGVSYQVAGQVLGARHVAADQQLQPHLPEAEIRKRDDGAPADPQQIFQHHPRLPRRLQGLRQDHVVEGVVGIVDEVGVGVALHHREPLGDAAVDALARQFDAAAVDAAALEQLQQVAVAAADVEHFRAALDHLGDQQMIAAIILGAMRRQRRSAARPVAAVIMSAARLCSGRAPCPRIAGRRGRCRRTRARRAGTRHGRDRSRSRRTTPARSRR